MNINEAKLVSFVSTKVAFAYERGYQGVSGNTYMLEDDLATLIGLLHSCQPEPEKVEVIKEIPSTTIGLDVPNCPQGIADWIIHILQAMKSSRKVETIKGVRMLTGLGLKEAKDLVEANWISFDQSYLKAENATQRDRIATLENENKSLKDDLAGWSNEANRAFQQKGCE